MVSGSDLVDQKLAIYGRHTLDAIQAYVPDDDAGPWLYDLIRHYLDRPAKLIRPSLCIATCRAYGGSIEDATPSAVAIELFHNAFLVHDDIADESINRRGLPTLHRVAGVGLALNAGSALAVLGYGSLRKNVAALDSDVAMKIFDEFDTMTLRTLEGQARELGWQRSVAMDLTSDDYLEMVGLKTCWYTTILPLRVGALVGTWGRARLERLLELGFYMGAAFQIQDDVLNLTGSEDLYGKERDGDLYEGKRTLMLIHLMEHVVGPDRARLTRYLSMSRSDRTADDVAEIRDLMERHNSISAARRFGQDLASKAESLFDEAFDAARPGPDREFVRLLIRHLLQRNH